MKRHAKEQGMFEYRGFEIGINKEISRTSKKWRRLAGICLMSFALVTTQACKGDPPTLTPEGASPAEEGVAPVDSSETESLTIEILNTQLAVGLERFAFHIKDSKGNVIRDGSVSLSFGRLNPDGSRSDSADGEALYFGQGLPNGGSWIAYSEFDASGRWA